MIPLQKDINFYFRFNSTSLPFEALFRSKVRIENISNTYTIFMRFYLPVCWCFKTTNKINEEKSLPTKFSIFFHQRVPSNFQCNKFFLRLKDERDLSVTKRQLSLICIERKKNRIVQTHQHEIHSWHHFNFLNSFFSKKAVLIHFKLFWPH